MFRNHAVIYALDKKLNRLSASDRQIRVQVLLDELGTEILDTVTEQDNISAKSLRAVLADAAIKYRAGNAPFIAVWDWEDAKGDATTRLLVNYSAKVLDASAVTPDQRSIRQHIRDGAIQSGPVLMQMVNNLSRLEQSLQERDHPNAQASANKQAAREYALEMWPHIVAAVEAVGASNKSAIVRWLNEAGHCTVNGHEIKPTQLERYVIAAGKEAEWESLV